jgi:hypothetical protein
MLQVIVAYALVRAAPTLSRNHLVESITSRWFLALETFPLRERSPLVSSLG